MSEPTSLDYLRDARLAPLATATEPVWLWDAAGVRVLWANAAGLAEMRARTLSELRGKALDAESPLAREIAGLARSLPLSGVAHLARLRHLAAGLGRPRLYACTPMVAPGGRPAILVAAAEAPLRPLTLAQRAAIIGADVDGATVLAPDGAPLFPPTGESVVEAPDRALLDAATRDGRASREAAGDGIVTLDRLGTGDTTALLLTISPRPPAPLDAGADEVAEAAAADDAPPSAEPPSAAATLADVAAAMAASSPADGAGQVAIPEPDAFAPPVMRSPAAAGRRPLRFVWRMDVEARFSIAADDFLRLVGQPTAAQLGRPWPEFAAALGLDPDGRIARAFASRDTWSGLPVDWPVDGAADRLPVALSGLPTTGPNRSFAGYQGFGVCRDVAAIATAVAARRGSGDGAAEPYAADHPAADDRPADVFSPPVDPDALPPSETRPQLMVVPPAPNVVPFRGGGPAAAERRPALTTVERNAFQEIARALGARVAGGQTEQASPAAAAQATEPAPAADGDLLHAEPRSSPPKIPPERHILDRMPVAVLAYRLDRILYANKPLLDWSGFASVSDIAAAGGFDRLFAAEPLEPTETDAPSRTTTLMTRNGAPLPLEAKLFTVPWEGESALLLVLSPVSIDERHRASELALRAAESEALELRSILDTATDGVIVTDADGSIIDANRSAEALFGYDALELGGRALVELFAPESQREAADYLAGLAQSSVASILNDGREVIGRVKPGGLIPLFMTMGRTGDQPARFCAVFRDITQWKRAEEDLVNARREAERASSAKTDVLTKISHEIRTPLNAIIGFSETMIEQRLGPLGNERYRDYLRDIHTSGQHVLALLNDLLDISKIEAGKLDLDFVRVELNVVTQEAVAMMQPQANRERIIIRTSLSPTVPPVVADARSIRQIAINLLSNSIKFTGAGGQVIVSTALTEQGEAVLRVRDTGLGMSEDDIATAMEPFRQLPHTARASQTSGSGLGLPLTKALAEANRASFHIKSAVNSGTLIEIIFPATRVLSQ